MTTVLNNTTEHKNQERLKEYYFGSAARQFTNDDQPITIGTLQDWKNSGDVRGPLSRDEFIRLVREQLIVETTVVWEVWDEKTVWPKLQAEKLTLFREAYRTVITQAPPPSPLTPEPTENFSADELIASVLEESRGELPISKPSLLWRLPLIGWILTLCGWKPAKLPIVVMSHDSASEFSTSPLSHSATSSCINSTTFITNRDTANTEADFELSSSTMEPADSGPSEFGGLSLDGLDDANPAAHTKTSELATARVRDTVSQVTHATPSGEMEWQTDEPSSDGKLQGAIAKAVNYFDAKAIKSATDLPQDAGPRLVDRLAILAYQLGQFCLRPFRGILAAAGKAIAAERVLVTGQSFQRMDDALGRILRHPVTWGALTAIAFVVVALFALQPRGPDELDLFAVRKLKEAQEAIQSVRASQPDEKTWSEFSNMLTAELAPVKEELHRGMNINRPVKEGLWLALEYRLPRLLKEGRSKPSPAEGEFVARIRNAEYQIQKLSR